MTKLTKLVAALIWISPVNAEINTRLDITLAEVVSGSIQSVDHVDWIFLDVSSPAELSANRQLPSTNNLVVYGAGVTLSEGTTALIEMSEGFQYLAFEEVKLRNISFLANMKDLESLAFNGVDLQDGTGLGDLEYVSTFSLSQSIVKNLTFPSELASITIDRNTYISGNFESRITEWLKEPLSVDGTRMLSITGDF